MPSSRRLLAPHRPPRFHARKARLRKAGILIRVFRVSRYEIFVHGVLVVSRLHRIPHHKVESLRPVVILWGKALQEAERIHALLRQWHNINRGMYGAVTWKVPRSGCRADGAYCATGGLSGKTPAQEAARGDCPFCQRAAGRLRAIAELPVAPPVRGARIPLYASACGSPAYD
jgi:hypothetical protein